MAPPVVTQDVAALALAGAIPALIPGPRVGGAQANVLLWYVDPITGRVALGPGPSGDATTPAPSAAIDMQATDAGLLLPRLTTAQRNAIPSPAPYLLIVNTTTGQAEIWSGSAWVPLGGVTGNGWLTSGNTLGAPGLLGSLNAEDVHGVTSGVRRWTVLATGEFAIGSADPTAGDVFEVQVGGVRQLFVIATGEVGIGGAPATPSEVLRVERSQDAPTTTIVTNPNAGAGATAALRLLADARGYEVATTSSGAPVPSSLVVTDLTAGAPRVTVTPIGDVGIGPVAPTPGNLLEVRGDLTNENIELLGISVDVFAVDTLTLTGTLSASLGSGGPLGVNGTTISVNATAQLTLSSTGPCQTRALPVSAGDSTTGNPIGGLTAAASVDISQWIEAAQATAGQAPILPNPTDVTKSCDVTVMNVGAQALTMYGVAIAVGRKYAYTWSPALAAWLP